MVPKQVDMNLYELGNAQTNKSIGLKNRDQKKPFIESPVWAGEGFDVKDNPYLPSGLAQPPREEKERMRPGPYNLRDRGTLKIK